MAGLNKKIVVVGSSNTDMIIKLDSLPQPGETIIGGQFFTAAGGKGANQAVAAARAGGRVTFIARIGRDSFGDQALRGFRRDGIKTTYVSQDASEPSGVALIFVDRQGENSIAVASGANNRLTPAQVRKAADAIGNAAVLLMQLETPLETVRAAAELGEQAGIQVILNPAPAQALPGELLQRVSILTPNESEAEILTGVRVTNERTAAKAATKLHARGVPTVIITLGNRGAFISCPDHQRLISTFTVNPVDTTAAGDVFNGALAVALAENQSLERAVLFANAAAAISVTRLGAQTSAPKRHEIEQFLTANHR